jgi:hypothetical protein
MGRVCSALPGATVDGMGAHHARHDVPAAGNGAPSHPVPADPPPEASSVTVDCERRVRDSYRRPCGRRRRSRGSVGRRHERSQEACPAQRGCEPVAERVATQCSSGKPRLTDPHVTERQQAPSQSRKGAQMVAVPLGSAEPALDPLHLGDNPRSGSRARQRRPGGRRRRRGAGTRSAYRNQRRGDLALAHSHQGLNHPIECLAHLSACDPRRRRRVLDRQRPQLLAGRADLYGRIHLRADAPSHPQPDQPGAPRRSLEDHPFCSPLR